jgi:hypothetical protein
MALTTAEIQDISNRTLDFHVRESEVHFQNIQDRPLLRDMKKNMKDFPGTKEFLTMDYQEFAGGNFGGIESETDKLTFENYHLNKKLQYSYHEHFSGLKVSMKELERRGIDVKDTSNGFKGASPATGSEKIALQSVLKEKNAALSEDWASGMNRYLWADGTADAKGMAGITALIVDDPDAAGLTIGGMTKVDSPYWTNRANVGMTWTRAQAGDFLLFETIQDELIQLRRYADGRTPIHKGYAGSDMMSALRAERRAMGVGEQNGFTGTKDVSVGAVVIDSLVVEYDPSLDDMGMTKRLYIVDHKSINLWCLQGKDMRIHAPASPHDELVFYKGLLTSGQVAASRRNTSAVLAFT